MQTPEITAMTEYTVNAVERLERQCFSSPWSLASLTSELSNPNAVFRTAGIGGEIAGYAGMHHVVDEGYIMNIAVSPSYRRLGIARALIRDLLVYAKEHGLRMVTLEVRESNEAARLLYHGFGFEESGRRKNFYTLPSEDGIIMTKFFRGNAD